MRMPTVSRRQVLGTTRWSFSHCSRSWAARSSAAAATPPKRPNQPTLHPCWSSTSPARRAKSLRAFWCTSPVPYASLACTSCLAVLGVADAVERAGGPKARAALESINLAAELIDGQQVVVPARPRPAARRAAPPLARPRRAQSPRSPARAWEHRARPAGRSPSARRAPYSSSSYQASGLLPPARSSRTARSMDHSVPSTSSPRFRELAPHESRRSETWSGPERDADARLAGGPRHGPKSSPVERRAVPQRSSHRRGVSRRARACGTRSPGRAHRSDLRRGFARAGLDPARGPGSAAGRRPRHHGTHLGRRTARQSRPQ